jgi:prephenate dehydrogenase
MTVNRLAVLGLGLIGGSVALGAREGGLAREIIGWNRSPGPLQAALTSGVIDRSASTLREAVEEADLILLAVPVLATPALALEVHGHASPESVITDAGSTKESIVTAMEAVTGGAPFVGGHPIAGAENSGLSAARKDLFVGAPFILTPTERTPPEADGLVESFWAGLGARVMRLAPAEHDRLFAHISHLPHVAAYALVGAVFTGLSDPGLIARFMGGGFRDYTRIAASDAGMWRDICLDNRRHLQHAIGLLEKELSCIREALSTGDGEALESIFNKARTLKRQWSQT